MWSSFIAVFQKEFLHVRRDRGTLSVALAIPLFQLILFGFIDMTVSNLPTVVVDQDQSSFSRELISQQRIKCLDYFFRTFHLSSFFSFPDLIRFFHYIKRKMS